MCKEIKSLNIVTFYILTIFSTQAQSTLPLLDNYLQQLRTGTYQPAPQEIWQDRQNEGAILNALQKYQTDTLPEVRAKVYYLTQKVGLASHESAIRQKVVNMLLEGCRDADSGNSGIASSYLEVFSPADFDEPAKEQLRELIQQPAFHYYRILRLAGYVQLQDQIDIIQQKIASGELTVQAKWSAYLALARMGDESALYYCLGKVSRYPVNDDVVYELLPELIYIRQPLAINYVIDVLYHDKPACESADPEASEYILCGYRVMEMLAPVIRDFPLTLDVSGDLDVESYQVALQQVRDWFQEQGDQYIIIKDTF